MSLCRDKVVYETPRRRGRDASSVDPKPRLHHLRAYATPPPSPSLISIPLTTRSEPLRLPLGSFVSGIRPLTASFYLTYRYIKRCSSHDEHSVTEYFTHFFNRATSAGDPLSNLSSSPRFRKTHPHESTSSRWRPYSVSEQPLSGYLGHMPSYISRGPRCPVRREFISRPQNRQRQP
jgi:hypothetical protein